MPAAQIGTDVTVFTLAGNALVGVLHDAEITIQVKEVEAKGVADTDDWPQHVGRSTTIRGNMEIADGGSAVLMGTANSSNPAVSYSITTGAGTYSGTALITSIGHRFERDNIQMHPVEMKVRGTHSVTV